MNITRLSILRPVGISMIVAFFVVLGVYLVVFGAISVIFIYKKKNL